MAWLIGIFILISLVQFHSCQGSDTTSAACSNTASVMILTKEEMKGETRAQVAEALATNNQQQRCNCTCDANRNQLLNMNEEVEEIGRNLTELSTELKELLLPVMNKLMTLHQPGKTASHPAISCVEILEFNPTTPSGYYWLETPGGSTVHEYCDMTLSCKGVGGGWMQVAKLNMTNTSHQCPPGTRLRTNLPKRLCGVGSYDPGCSSVMVDAHGIKYNQVCGKIIAYQDKSTDAFGMAFSNPLRSPQTIDANYVDGISLTHGRNPRKHIWTFAAALDEVGTFTYLNCPCINVHQSSPQPPSFVGNDYFCDTGSTHRFEHIFYGDDPLWDGAGCGPANTCCSLNNPPWFYKQLSSKTSDDIEMRICRDQNNIDEDIAVDIIELYVK